MNSWTEMLPGGFTPSPATAALLSHSTHRATVENVREAMAAWLMNASFIAEESRNFAPLDLAGSGMPAKVAQVLGIVSPHEAAFIDALLADIAAHLKTATEIRGAWGRIVETDETIQLYPKSTIAENPLAATYMDMISFRR